MKNLTSCEIKEKFLNFFKNRKHEILPSSLLVPENDSSVLFNTAGMQPLVPYILGERHPKGKRLVNVQKCIRTNDIENVGDDTHHTFFEMLGNWSLGDYFKKEALNWSWKFLIDKKEGLGLKPEKIYVTVFEGNEDAPKDKESYKIWEKIFIESGLNPKERIFFLNAENNFWSAGENGPCGPDSEIFYDRTKKGLGKMTKKKFIEADEKEEVVEIWNDVFMEYEKKDGKIIGKLKDNLGNEIKNVDTGAGVERITAIMQNKNSTYETDLFFEAIKILEKETKKKYSKFTKEFRIILDHIRTSVFMISDGVRVSNKEQGYVLRRILRRVCVKMKDLDFKHKKIDLIINFFIEKYGKNYLNIYEQKQEIKVEIINEVKKFEITLEKGSKEFEKIVDLKNKKNNISKLEFGMVEVCKYARNEISGEHAFTLFSTYGFPIEIIEEEAKWRGLIVDKKSFFEKIKKHSKSSSIASVKKFKGGLGGNSVKITAFHTTTHLMLAGLQNFLGEGVHQKGSNITEERTRFDFSYNKKVSRDILDEIEDYVNGVIEKKIDIEVIDMDKKKAKEQGVEGSFWEKYPDVVKVWTIQENGKIFSKELCGGPHVKNTSEIKKFGKFKIKKEESSSSGVRRIKAVFEK